MTPKRPELAVALLVTVIVALAMFVGALGWLDRKNGK